VVEFVALEAEAAPAALSRGDVDLLTHFDRSTAAAWYEEQTKSGTIVDLGSIYESEPDIRIIATAAFKERAPELALFAGKVKPGNESFANLAGGISEGRTGISPIVAALTVLKGQNELWSAWVPEEVATAARLRIAGGVVNFRPCTMRPNGRCQ